MATIGSKAESALLPNQCIYIDEDTGNRCTTEGRGRHTISNKYIHLCKQHEMRYYWLPKGTLCSATTPDGKMCCEEAIRGKEYSNTYLCITHQNMQGVSFQQFFPTSTFMCEFLSDPTTRCDKLCDKNRMMSRMCEEHTKEVS